MMSIRGFMVFLTECWLTLCELAPWFLFGALVAGLIHGLAPVGFVKKRLNGYLGVVWATLFGIPLPLCSCAVIPTGIGLRKSGASEGASIGFLIATPQTGVDSIFVTAALLGWPLAIFKLLVALVLGCTAGFVIEFRERMRTKSKDQTPASPTKAAADSSPVSGLEASVNAVTPSSGRTLMLPVIQPAAPPEPVSPQGWAAIVRYIQDSFGQAIEIIRSIYLWIILGIVLSAALKSWFPLGVIQEWLGPSGAWLQVPLSLLISLPLYVCATASVPVAAALVDSGLSVGATIVFLIAGPATNVATMGAIYRSFSRSAFITYMATVVVGSIAAAYLYDWGIAGFTKPWGPTSVADHVGHDHRHDHDSNSWLSMVAAALLLSLFVGFTVQRSVARMFTRAKGDRD